MCGVLSTLSSLPVWLREKKNEKQKEKEKKVPLCDVTHLQRNMHVLEYGRCGCDDCADFVHGTDAVAIAVQLLHEKIPGYEVTYR